MGNVRTNEDEWVCDICGEPATRKIYKNLGGSYVRHYGCEPKPSGAPKFELKGLGWSRHGYTKDFEG
jgi:hypothetical protein